MHFGQLKTLGGYLNAECTSAMQKSIRRGLEEEVLPRFGETEALKIKPSEIKGWLESVQDEEDLENSTVDKIRRVMHLVYSTAQANDLIPRTVEANPVTHVHIATTTEYEAILVTPLQAWNIICRMEAFARLLTLLVAVTGLRIGEVLALRWKHADWSEFRIHVVSNFVRGKFGEPKSAASKKPVVLHPLVMGLLKNWRETTAYAGDEDFIFAFRPAQSQSTARAEHAGRRPSPASGQAGGQDSRWPSFRLPQPPARVNLVPGRDRNRLQNYSGHAALGRPFNPAQGLRALAHGQAHGGSGKDDRSHGSERENCSTIHPVGVGDRPWVILPVSCHKISAKLFGMMVARDGVEPPTPAFSDCGYPLPSTTCRSRTAA